MDIRGFFKKPGAPKAEAPPPAKPPAPEAKGLARKRAPEEDVVDLTGEDEVPDKRARKAGSGEFPPQHLRSSPPAAHARGSQSPLRPPRASAPRRRRRRRPAPRLPRPRKRPVASTRAPRAHPARLLVPSTSRASAQAAARVGAGVLGALQLPRLPPARPLTAPAAGAGRRGVGSARPPGSGATDQPGRAPAGAGRLPGGRDVCADGHDAPPLSARPLFSPTLPSF